MSVSTDLRQRIADLYAAYADCIDAERFDDWPEFFTEAAWYRIIARENFDRNLPLSIVSLKGKAMMKDRVYGITSTIFHAPYYQRHIISLNAPRALVLAVVALFFIWGGLTSLNDVLIPKLKGLFSLSYTEAMLTQFAFFMAYFIVSLPAGSLIARVGYLKGIVIGLGTMAIGCLMFIPASGSGIYATFLAALFVLAAGITILQVAANPLIANMGSAETASSRLTLAQAFNSLGTTIFPPIGGAIILGSMAEVDPAKLGEAERATLLTQESAIIGNAYLAIAAILLLVAGYFWLKRTQLPNNREEATSLGGAFGLLAHPSGLGICRHTCGNHARGGPAIYARTALGARKGAADHAGRGQFRSLSDVQRASPPCFWARSGLESYRCRSTRC